MTTNKRKKNVKQRGSKTHGWGSMKKHRGKGNKGGAGRAGTGKKAGQKTPSYWQERHYGKSGFKKKGVLKKIKPINLDDLAKKAGAKAEVNLKDLGYNKLLGKGKGLKLKITAEEASAKAVEKVKAAGGEVILPKIIKKEE
jgi:large subunit ribosomal protein L15